MIYENLQPTTTNTTNTRFYEYAPTTTTTTGRKDGLSTILTVFDEVLPLMPAIPDRRSIPGIKRVIFSGPVTIILWNNDTKTIVRRSSDDPNDHYAAFTAAVCKKLFGSSSAIRKIVKKAEKECAK